MVHRRNDRGLDNWRGAFDDAMGQERADPTGQSAGRCGDQRGSFEAERGDEVARELRARPKGIYASSSQRRDYENVALLIVIVILLLIIILLLPMMMVRARLRLRLRVRLRVG